MKCTENLFSNILTRPRCAYCIHVMIDWVGILENTCSQCWQRDLLRLNSAVQSANHQVMCINPPAKKLWSPFIRGSKMLRMVFAPWANCSHILQESFACIRALQLIYQNKLMLIREEGVEGGGDIYYWGQGVSPLWIPPGNLACLSDWRIPGQAETRRLISQLKYLVSNHGTLDIHLRVPSFCRS